MWISEQRGRERFQHTQPVSLLSFLFSLQVTHASLRTPGTILLFLFIFVYLKTEPGIFVTGSLFIVYIACLVIDLAFVLSTRSKLVDDSALSAAPQFKFGMGK